MEKRVFQPGQVIFSEGDDSHEAFRILSGQVQIAVESGGQAVTLAYLASGDIFGEMGMIDDVPRSATARALQVTECEVLTPKMFNDYIIQNPARLIPFLSSFFERLRTTSNMLSMELRRTGQVPAAPAPSHEHMGLGTPGQAPPLGGKEARQPPIKVQLEALTAEGRDRSSSANTIVGKFPFLMGRPSYAKEDVFTKNDFTIADHQPFMISRNHCAIEREGDKFFVRDRGSSLGTIVNGEPLSLFREKLHVELKMGENIIQLGDEGSPYQYKITIG